MKLADLDASEVLKLLVTLSGVFLASAYVAGRIYLQAYFAVFELDPMVLDFGPQDVAFQSRSVWLPILILIVLVPVRLGSPQLSQSPSLVKRAAVILVLFLLLISGRIIIDLVFYSVSDWRGLLGGVLNLLPLLSAGVVLLQVLPAMDSLRLSFSWLFGLLLLFVLLLPAAAGYGRGLENRFGHPVGSFRRVALTSDVQLLENWSQVSPDTYASPEYRLLGISNSYIAVWDQEEETGLVIRADEVQTLRLD